MRRGAHDELVLAALRACAERMEEFRRCDDVGSDSQVAVLPQFLHQAVIAVGMRRVARQEPDDFVFGHRRHGKP